MELPRMLAGFVACSGMDRASIHGGMILKIRCGE